MRLALQGDVAVEADVVAMFDAAQSRLGRLDGVVINAGIVAPSMPLADMDSARLKRVFEVNVYGAYLCARESARRLSKDRGGSGGAVVLISSAASRLGSPFEYVDYAGSKAALDTLAIGLAKELAPQGVRVNAVRPGLIETDIHASGGQPDRAQRLGATTPMGRPGRPEEVAAAIVWLLERWRFVYHGGHSRCIRRSMSNDSRSLPEHPPLLAGWFLGLRFDTRRMGMQAGVLDQKLADVQKANPFVLERRAAGIVAKVDIGALIDGIGNAESP